MLGGSVNQDDLAPPTSGLVTRLYRNEHLYSISAPFAAVGKPESGTLRSILFVKKLDTGGMLLEHSSPGLWGLHRPTAPS